MSCAQVNCIFPQSRTLTLLTSCLFASHDCSLQPQVADKCKMIIFTAYRIKQLSHGQPINGTGTLTADYTGGILATIQSRTCLTFRLLSKHTNIETSKSVNYMLFTCVRSLIIHLTEKKTDGI